MVQESTKWAMGFELDENCVGQQLHDPSSDVWCLKDDCPFLVAMALGFLRSDRRRAISGLMIGNRFHARLTC